MDINRRAFFSCLSGAGVVAAMTRRGTAGAAAEHTMAARKPGTIGRWLPYSAGTPTESAQVWSWKDGLLTCTGSPKGYLYSGKSYTNFVLRLEWRWPPGKKAGNGGVLLRMTGKHKIWPRSLEAQINAGDAGDFWGLDGYSLAGPAERLTSVDHPQFGKLTNLKKLADAEKPTGEWNRYEIIADGETVTLKINGKLVNRAVHCEAVPGRICITAEGDAIKFRNIDLRS